MTPRLLSVQEAVLYLGYKSEASLRMAIHRKVFPKRCIVRLGGRVKLDREELDRLIEEKKGEH